MGLCAGLALCLIGCTASFKIEAEPSEDLVTIEQLNEVVKKIDAVLVGFKKKIEEKETNK